MSRKKGQRAWNRVDIDEATLRELYLGHSLTAEQVAERLNVSQNVVYHRLRDLGITRSNSEAHIGHRPSNYKGRWVESRNGYVMITLSPDSPLLPMAITSRDGVRHVREHRLVMAQHLGRCLERWEIVHHKNHDKTDNRLENLELIQGQSHHNGETITHGHLVSLKHENVKLKQRVQELEQELEICLAALAAVTARESTVAK